jgi:ribosomal protein L13
MAEGRKITYKDVMNLEREMLKAPELPKEEQDITGKKEVMSVLRKGMLAYLKKGYSIQAVVETVNGKFPEFGISDADVRKMLPKVTRKKRAAKTASAGTRSNPENQDLKSDEDDSGN